MVLAAPVISFLPGSVLSFLGKLMGSCSWEATVLIPNVVQPHDWQDTQQPSMAKPGQCCGFLGRRDYTFVTTPTVTSFSPQAMQMVPVPSNTFGSFFDGDCYVVLAVSGSGRREGGGGGAGGGAYQRAKPAGY